MLESVTMNMKDIIIYAIPTSDGIGVYHKQCDLGIFLQTDSLAEIHHWVAHHYVECPKEHNVGVG